MATNDGIPHFIEYSPKEAGHFKGFIQRAKKDNTHGAAVDVHKVGDYKNMRMFTTPDGLAGFAVNQQGELNSVFKHPSAPYKNVAMHAAEHAKLMAGATHLSAFDAMLPREYAKGGFKPLSHVQWNEAYKPRGWKVSIQGRPAVAFSGADANIAKEAKSGNFKYAAFSTPETADYDVGMTQAKTHGEGNTNARR